MGAEASSSSTEKSSAGKALQRSALGRTAFIGELYDARTESFCTRKLFSTSLPEHFVPTQRNWNFNFDYSSSDQLSERFDVLKIEADLKLPILLNAGTLTITGNGTYLNMEKESERTITCSLICNMSTFHDKLSAPFNEIAEYIDESAFNDDRFTHVVSEIHWGAKCVVTLIHQSSDSNENTKAKGMIQGQLKTLTSLINGETSGKVDYNNLKIKSKQFNGVTCKMYGDILPEELTEDPAKAAAFISDMCKKLKNSNEKGKPITYAMISIDMLKGLKNCKIKTMMPISVHESFIEEMVFIFQDIEVLKQKFNDLRSDLVKYEKYLPEDFLLRIRDILREIKRKESDLKTDLADDLSEVRAGTMPLSDLKEKVKRYKLSDLNEEEHKAFSKKLESIKSKIDFISLCMSKNVQYLGKDDDLELIMNRNIGHDFFVMYISEELRNKNQELYRDNLNFFLVEAETANKNSHFLIVDFDINKKVTCEVNEVKIMKYKISKIKSHDVYEEAKAKAAKNIVKLINPKDKDNVEGEPTNLRDLRLRCPGSISGTCSIDPLIWKCHTCERNVKYDGSNHFYCRCGKAKIHLFEFKCNSLRHGDKFLRFDKNFPLKEEILKFTFDLNVGITDIALATMMLPHPLQPLLFIGPLWLMTGSWFGVLQVLRR